VVLCCRLFTSPPKPLLITPPIDSVSNKEQKQILADINAGSQKFGRKLLSRQPSHRRDKGTETITPVTVLPEQQQEDRRGRQSTNSTRPKLPKRNSSMRRAYNYFFGGVPQPEQPPSPTSPVVTEAHAEAVKSPKDDDKSARNVGVDTPPQTPAHEASHAAKDASVEAGTL
jgi:hypothetical protein